MTHCLASKGLIALETRVMAEYSEFISTFTILATAGVQLTR